jgi:hypothetical protein
MVHSLPLSSSLYRSYFLQFGRGIKAEARELEQRLRLHLPADKCPLKDPHLERHQLRRAMKQAFPLARLRLLLQTTMQKEDMTPLRIRSF